MPEVYASNEVVAELLNPISGAVLLTVTFRQDISASERPVYVERAYSRSGAVSSRRLRSRGSITLRKSPESFALVDELKRWQKGMVYYPLTSDLRGRTYRHPNLRLTFTNADGSVDRQIAYGIRLSDRTVSVPTGEVVGDSYSLDVLRGFDLSESDGAENYEPKRALDFARTGSKTYVNSAGTLSIATDGQPAFGVPYGTYSASKAGLILEGLSVNLLSSNQATGTDTSSSTAGFSSAGDALYNGGATLSSVTTQFFQGARSLQIAAPNNGSLFNGFATTAIAASANTAYTASAMIKAPAGTPMVFKIRDYTNGVTGTTFTWVATGGWDFVYSTVTTGGSAVTDLHFACYLNNTAAATTYWADALKIEANPFPTSWVDGTRQPDLCGIAYVMNDLKDSHDLTQSRSWVVSGMSQPTKSGDDNTVTFGATTQYLYQAVTPLDAASTTRTAVVRMKLGTLSGSVLLRVLDQSGTLIGSTTINTTSLSASEYRTFYVTVTPGATVTGLRVQLIGNSGTGTVLVRSLGLVQGSHPGLEVRTTDTAIPKPADGGLDPAWQQNGSLKVRILPPAEGAAIYNLIGGESYASTQSGTMRLFHFTDTNLRFDRRHNGATGGIGGAAGSARLTIANSLIYNGSPNDVELVHKNYLAIDPATGQWRRYMPQELWVDGSLVASQDVAALYGASSWAAIDPSKLISDGNVQATISAPSDGGPIIRYPTLPQGAIPAV